MIEHRWSCLQEKVPLGETVTGLLNSKHDVLNVDALHQRDIRALGPLGPTVTTHIFTGNRQHSLVKVTDVRAVSCGRTPLSMDHRRHLGSSKMTR